MVEVLIMAGAAGLARVAAGAIGIWYIKRQVTSMFSNDEAKKTEQRVRKVEAEMVS